MNHKYMRWIKLFVLASGAGIIFQLPYLRYAFYTQLQNALGFNHLEYGALMSVYALVAMLSYFPGGWIADKLSSRFLLTFSLVSTGISGFFFATFPSYELCLLIHGLWGLTTILTYWSALLKVTRTLGDEKEQGRLFGLLEGGRGIMSAIGAYGVVLLFTQIGADALGMAFVIRIFSGVQIINGIITWIIIRDPEVRQVEEVQKLNIRSILAMKEVWYLSGIIFSAYSLYAGLSYVSPYLQDVFGVSETLATSINIFQRYIMMFLGGAIGGIIADRIGSRTKVIFYGFMIAIAALFVILLMPSNGYMFIIVSIFIIILAGAVYALRGLYFSITGELGISLQITGTVIGFASLIGYLPDVFIYPIIGSWLDTYPGAKGYSYMFILLIGLAILGLFVIGIVRRSLKMLPINLET